MRRIVGLVLVALGVALIALAIALPTYVYPRIAKVPADPNKTIRAEGTGITVLLPRSVEDGGTQIYTDQTVVVLRNVRGEVRSGSPAPGEGQAFYRTAIKVEVEGKGLLTADVEGASFDGDTGLANNCCGDYRITDPTDTVGQPIEHEGIISKFPFNTKRQDYPMWDSDIKSAATARFDGTEKIMGLQTYRFVQNIPDTVIGQEDVPGSLIGIPDEPSVKADRVYATVRTIWVEPYTGAIIKGQEQVNQRLIANGKTAPIIVGKLGWDDPSVKANVDEYSSAALGLRFVTRLGPIGGWILGPILLLVGLTLLAVSRRRQYDDEWDDQDQTHFQTV
jgi:hypothetical protein